MQPYAVPRAGPVREGGNPASGQATITGGDVCTVVDVVLTDVEVSSWARAFIKIVAGLSISHAVPRAEGKGQTLGGLFGRHVVVCRAWVICGLTAKELRAAPISKL